MGSLEEAARGLAEQAGAGSFREMKPLAGGANNRVFRLETSAGTYLLKSYFRHPDDPRDRLGAEFAFSQFAWKQGLRSLPRPLACDAESGLALFEYIFGSSLAGSVARDVAVDLAIEFFRGLNRARSHAEAARLPRAAESCFTLEQHLATIDRRVHRLQSVADSSIADFLERELAPAWCQALAQARYRALALGLDLESPLPREEQCLSPSDFGFHNAILGNDGCLRFIDFEYAGWDDPAKVICDFFCQPAVPAPMGAFDRFANAVAAELPSPTFHVERSRLLLPAYRVKWICILLNEFLPVGESRRAFSGANPPSRKEAQLAKARAVLEFFKEPSIRKAA